MIKNVLVIKLIDSLIFVLPDFLAIWVNDIHISVWVLYEPYFIFINFLENPIRKLRLFFSICKYILFSPVGKSI